jgi:hypothetical protein
MAIATVGLPTDASLGVRVVQVLRYTVPAVLCRILQGCLARCSSKDRIREKAMELLTECSFVACREASSNSPWHRFTQPTVVTRDYGNTACLSLDGRHPEHLECARWHHEDIGHVVGGCQTAFVDRAKIPSPGPGDSVSPGLLI